MKLGRMCRYALGNRRYEEILEELGTNEEAVLPSLSDSEDAKRWRLASMQAALKSRRFSGKTAIMRPNEDNKWFWKRIKQREGAKLGKVAGGFRMPAETGLPEWMTLQKPEKFGY